MLPLLRSSRPDKTGHWLTKRTFVSNSKKKSKYMWHLALGPLSRSNYQALDVLVYNKLFNSKHH